MLVMVFKHNAEFLYRQVQHFRNGKYMQVYIINNRTTKSPCFMHRKIEVLDSSKVQTNWRVSLAAGSNLSVIPLVKYR